MADRGEVDGWATPPYGSYRRSYAADAGPGRASVASGALGGWSQANLGVFVTAETPERPEDPTELALPEAVVQASTAELAPYAGTALDARVIRSARPPGPAPRAAQPPPRARRPTRSRRRLREWRALVDALRRRIWRPA